MANEEGMATAVKGIRSVQGTFRLSNRIRDFEYKGVVDTPVYGSRYRRLGRRELRGKADPYYVTRKIHYPIRRLDHKGNPSAQAPIRRGDTVATGKGFLVRYTEYAKGMERHI